MGREAGSVEWLAVIGAMLDAGRPCALATVLEVDGSAPAGPGAKAVFQRSGRIHGTVGGGELEAEVERRARQALERGVPAILTFGLQGSGEGDCESVCGGTARLLVDPTAVRSRAEFQRAREASENRRRGVWLTSLRPGSPLQVDSRFLAEDQLPASGGFPGNDVLAAVLREEVPRLIAKPDEVGVEVFVEPLVPRPVLVIVGGGHVGQALAVQASLVGFEIVVIEDRPEFADPERYPPGTKTRCGDLSQEVAAWPAGRDTYLAIATRGHEHDAAALRACIRRPAAYIGMIGSRRKVSLLRRQFLESGWATAEEYDRVYAPIGVDIHARTVPEIAASIVAQLVAVRRGGAAPRIPLA